MESMEEKVGFSKCPVCGDDLIIYKIRDYNRTTGVHKNNKNCLNCFFFSFGINSELERKEDESCEDDD